jgi:biopolymer transport protein ExbD
MHSTWPRRGKPHDPNAHVIHVPGPRLLRRVALGFVRNGGGGRRKTSASLNMASFLDVLLVTVLFLLQSFSAGAECPSRTVHVPSAMNGEDMIDAPLVSVTHGSVMVDGIRADSAVGLADAERVVHLEELGRMLAQKKALWKAVQPSKPFPGVCVLQIDRETPAVVVKSVFATAARAGYPNVSFMVTQLPRM